MFPAWLTLLSGLFCQMVLADDSALYDPKTKESDLPDKYSYKGQGQPAFIQTLVPSKAQIDINQKYFEICEAELGAFPKETIDCRNAQPILMQRTTSDGKVTRLTLDNIPDSIPRVRDGENQVTFGPDNLASSITTCDKPSGIFRDMKNVGCVPGDRIGHVRNELSNGDQVDWVYICRKNSKFMADEFLYNELGLIGYNRNTGKTCYFAGQATLRFSVETEEEDNKDKSKKKTDIDIIVGKDIPPPKGRDFDKRAVSHWSMPPGGCTSCHSQGPFVRYPFTEQVCLADEDTEKCSLKPEHSFATVRECNHFLYKNRQALPGDYKCKKVMPERQPGMLYSVISPFTDSRLQEHIKDLSSKYKTSQDEYLGEFVGATLEKWHEPKRLAEKQAEPCTLCHAIGDGRYGERFMQSAFRLGQTVPQADYHFRSRLYWSNLSEKSKEAGFHDEKIKTAVLPAKNQGKDSKEIKNAVLEDLSEKAYLLAIQRVKECSTSKDKEPKERCKWEDHWTLEKIKEEPLNYLKANCSYCHDGNTEWRKLMTEADYKENAAIVMRRIQEDNPAIIMPPSGSLPPSAINIIKAYLQGK